jgi:hypothetical protein
LDHRNRARHLAYDAMRRGRLFYELRDEAIHQSMNKGA